MKLNLRVNLHDFLAGGVKPCLYFNLKKMQALEHCQDRVSLSQEPPGVAVFTYQVD
jgi:hypothetical protein